MRCGNGTDRAQHPIEPLGENWPHFGLDVEGCAASPDDPRTLE
jgi:hypothetical protein